MAPYPAPMADLIDPFGRTVRDLRISITDRCNFRCTYCMPMEGMQWLPRDQLLTYEEIARIARVCVEQFGFESIRLTGGEPLIRAHIVRLVELLARPALRQMMGHAVIDRPIIRGVADESLRRGVDGKTHFTRVHGAFQPDGRFHVRSTGPQGSHQLASTAAANALARVPDGDGIPPGGDVDVLLLTL